MGNKVIDGNIEWIKDADSGEVVGYKAADGTERYIPGVTFDPLTGGIKVSVGDVFGNLAAPSTRFSSDIRAHKKGFKTRPPVLMFHGDSNFSGQGAGTVGSPDRLFDAFRFTVSQRIKDYHPTLGGLPVKTTAFFGEGNSRNNAGVNASQYDPRMFYSGAGWYAPSANGIGGSMFICNSGMPGYFGINYGEAVDTVEVHFPVNTGLSDSVGVYSSDGTLVGSYSCSGAAGAAIASFTSAKFADGIVKFKNNATNGGAAYLAGALAWNSSAPCVLVVNASSVGATTSFFSYDPAYPWIGRGFYQTIKPSLSVIALTINDINTSVSASTYSANLSGIVSMAQKYGDVILGTGQPCNNTPWTSGTLASDIEAEMYKVASTYGAIATVSMQKEFGSWSAANAAGYEYDTHHGNDLNYYYQAGIYASMIAKAADYGM